MALSTNQLPSFRVGMSALGQRLWLLRTDRKISQREVAEAMGVSVQSISFWEGGKRVPGSDSLAWLCRYFNVSADFLLGLTDNPHGTGERVKRIVSTIGTRAIGTM